MKNIQKLFVSCFNNKLLVSDGHDHSANEISKMYSEKGKLKN